MFESILFQLLIGYFQALSPSRMRGLKSPNSYSQIIAYMTSTDNIVYMRSHRLTI